MLPHRNQFSSLLCKIGPVDIQAAGVPADSVPGNLTLPMLVSGRGYLSSSGHLAVLLPMAASLERGPGTGWLMGCAGSVLGAQWAPQLGRAVFEKGGGGFEEPGKEAGSGLRPLGLKLGSECPCYCWFTPKCSSELIPSVCLFTLALSWWLWQLGGRGWAGAWRGHQTFS